MKKLTLILMMILAIPFSYALCSDYGWDGGDGTTGSPYGVQNCTMLEQIGQDIECLDKSFQLTQDIDCSDTVNWDSGSGFKPIGDNSYRFNGTFNGNEFEISNLYINRSSTNNIGLFGYAYNSTIYDLGLFNINVTGSKYVGGLSGYSKYGNLTSCYSKGAVYSTNRYAGGLIGFSSSVIIMESYSSCNLYVEGGVIVGGLIGKVTGEGIVSESYATGKVVGSSNLGGLIGGCDWVSKIHNCYATGNINGLSDEVGGLVGVNERECIINNSYATGDINSPNGAVGGLIGENRPGSSDHDAGEIINCYATGDITGDSSDNDVGPLVGDQDVSGSITNSYYFSSSSCTNQGSGTCNSYGTGESPESYFYNNNNEPMASWDFTNIWSDNNSGADYPVLQWQLGSPIMIPNYTNFSPSSETTNFSEVDDLTNVTNMRLARQNKGKIQFPASQGVNADGQDYDSNVIIDTGFVSVNTAALDPSFNSSATISIEGVSCPVDVITYKEGTYSSQEEIIAGGRNCILDGVCSNVACSAGTLTFDVAHFTGFAAGANANLTIWAEPGYKNTTEPVAFYAGYINSTDGTPLSGECNISFSDAWGTEYEMDYNGSEYNYSKVFPTPGMKQYNVTCSNSSYVTLEANDTKSIGQYDVPEFSLLTFGLGLITILAGLYVIRRN